MNTASLRPFAWENISNPIQIAYRTYHHELDTLALAHLRLIVQCLYDKEASKSVMWVPAILKVYQVVQELASQIPGVEFFDSEYMESCQFCEPPSSGQSLVPEWEREGGYRERVLKVFEDYPRMFQMMMPIGLRATGPRASDHKTVLLFDAINAEDDRWNEIQKRLQSILPDNLDIELRQREAENIFFQHHFPSLLI